MSSVHTPVSETSQYLQKIRERVGTIVVGQDVVVERMLIALLTSGHLLLEGMPGLAKTLLVNTLARAMHLNFRRIQFTIDLLPSDILGSEILDERSGNFRTHQGPVFTNLLLADEINRAAPKVQGALLEAMQERKVTIGSQSYPLPTPFLVIATQNPIEQSGTFELPEAQLDRFMLCHRLGYPTVPGLLDAVRQPFGATGLNVDWFTVFGNHDGLVQGNFPTVLPLNVLALGSLKIITPPPGFSQANVDEFLESLNLAALLLPLLAVPGAAAFVKADAMRRILTRAQVVKEYFNTSGTPVGHGFTQENKTKGHAYYYVDRGNIRIVSLDTVNPNGYADGSIDKPQLTWMKKVIDEVPNKLVLIFSHHTSNTMANPLIATGLDLQPRVTGATVVKELLARPQVVAWINGHTHRNEIWAHTSPNGGFWEINTASHIDFPQQSRIIEIADNQDGTLSIFTTSLDHAAQAAWDGTIGSPMALASLSRELSANDDQHAQDGLAGEEKDLNTELIVKKPANFGV